MPEASKAANCRGLLVRMWANGRETQGSSATWRDDWDEVDDGGRPGRGRDQRDAASSSGRGASSGIQRSAERGGRGMGREGSMRAPRVYNRESRSGRGERDFDSSREPRGDRGDRNPYPRGGGQSQQSSDARRPSSSWRENEAMAKDEDSDASPPSPASPPPPPSKPEPLPVVRAQDSDKGTFFHGSTFRAVGASPEVISALAAIGITRPSHVQVSHAGGFVQGRTMIC